MVKFWKEDFPTCQESTGNFGENFGANFGANFEISETSFRISRLFGNFVQQKGSDFLVWTSVRGPWDRKTLLPCKEKSARREIYTIGFISLQIMFLEYFHVIDLIPLHRKFSQNWFCPASGLRTWEFVIWTLTRWSLRCSFLKAQAQRSKLWADQWYKRGPHYGNEPGNYKANSRKILYVEDLYYKLNISEFLMDEM